VSLAALRSAPWLPYRPGADRTPADSAVHGCNGSPRPGASPGPEPVSPCGGCSSGWAGQNGRPAENEQHQPQPDSAVHAPETSLHQ